MVKRLPTMRETQVQTLGWEDLLEKEMATHSSILAWKIPWTEEPVGYSPRGCKELDTTERLHFLYRLDFPAISWTVAHQAALCLGFSRQEYWSGLPFPLPGDLPHPEIEPTSLAF